MSDDYRDPRLHDVTDGDVSRAYRDVATERAPASLNERVLRDARAHTKGGYSHAVRWLRPLAWAATVGLSLAIVIQLTVLPGVESPDVALPQSAPETEAAGRVDGSAVDEFDRRIGPAIAEPAEQAPTSSAPASGGEVTGSDAFAITDAPLLDEAHDRAVEQSATEREAGAAVAEPPAEERASERNARDAAAELGDAATGPRAPDADAPARVRQMQRDSAFASTAAVEAPLANEALCDDAARSAPETWLVCIEALKRAGRDDDADAELERLIEAFPNFDAR